MSPSFSIHDYAFAYLVREQIYYYLGPGHPHESDQYHNWDGLVFIGLTSLDLGTVKRITYGMFPWAEKFKIVKMLWKIRAFTSFCK
jgi:hypothetical protein